MTTAEVTEFVGLDANAFTYLVEAIDENYDPNQDATALREERLAMYRIFLYAEERLCLTPTVVAQYRAMPDGERRRLHSQVLRFHLIEATWAQDPAEMTERVAQLTQVHPDPSDCRIVAEAVYLGLRHLVTFDSKFARRVNPLLERLKLVSPSEHWTNLGIPRGASPTIVPAPGNPRTAATWWKW